MREVVSPQDKYVVSAVDLELFFEVVEPRARHIIDLWIKFLGTSIEIIIHKLWWVVVIKQ